VDDAKRRITELRAVWISHRHADHHVGVGSVLSLRRQLLPPDAPPLPVFGPPPLRRVLSACNKLEDMHYTWIDQYCICPKEQGAGRDLQHCWTHAAAFDSAPIVKNICQVYLPSARATSEGAHAHRTCAPSDVVLTCTWSLLAVCVVDRTSKSVLPSHTYSTF
jgi:ribonuclease BN (tRNA processing enzyme)